MTRSARRSVSGSSFGFQGPSALPASSSTRINAYARFDISRGLASMSGRCTSPAPDSFSLPKSGWSPGRLGGAGTRRVSLALFFTKVSGYGALVTGQYTARAGAEPVSPSLESVKKRKLRDIPATNRMPCRLQTIQNGRKYRPAGTKQFIEQASWGGDAPAGHREAPLGRPLGAHGACLCPQSGSLNR